MIIKPARLWAALLPAMLLPFVCSLFYFVLLRDGIMARIAFGAAKIFIVIWPLFCFKFIFRARFHKSKLRTNPHFSALPYGILTGAAIAALMIGLMETPVGAMVRNNASNIREKTEFLGILDHFWIFATLISIFHSLVEEYYWRWFVYGFLRQAIKPAAAMAVSSFAFALHHVVVLNEYFSMAWAIGFGAAVGIGGAIWCWMYERQKTLAGAWVSHMIVDFVIMYIGHAIMTG